MSITITDLEAPVADRLLRQAVSHGRSIEAEIKEILTREVTNQIPGVSSGNICDAVRGLWQGAGSTDEMMRELRGGD